MLSFWTFDSSQNPEKNVSQFPQKYEAAQLFSTKSAYYNDYRLQR